MLLFHSRNIKLSFPGLENFVRGGMYNVRIAELAKNTDVREGNSHVPGYRRTNAIS